MRLFFNYKPLAIRYLLFAICLLAFAPALSAQAVGPEPAGPPVIESISPVGRPTGYAPFTLTITGYNFLVDYAEVSINTSTICRGGSSGCTVTSITTTQIQVLINAGLPAGEYSIMVTNPSITGLEEYAGDSNDLLLGIESMSTLTIIKYTSNASNPQMFDYYSAQDLDFGPDGPAIPVYANSGIGPGGYTGTNTTTFVRTPFFEDATIPTFFDLEEALPDTGGLGEWVLDFAFCTTQGGASTGTLSGTRIDDILFEENKTTTCEFSNTYIPPATIKVTKNVFPILDPGKFNLTIDGVQVGPFDVGNGGTTGTIPYGDGFHTISEYEGTGTDMADYTTTFSGDCDEFGNVTLNPGDAKECVITNTRNSGGGGGDGTLVVYKVTNGGPGTAVPFSFTGNTGITSISVDTSSSTGSNNDSRLLPAGTYNIAETPEPNWTLDSAVCSRESDGANFPPNTINLIAGDTVTCTFNNYYTAPVITGTITIIKDSPNNPKDFCFEVWDDGVGVQVGDQNGSAPGVICLDNDPGDATLSSTFTFSNLDATNSGTQTHNQYTIRELQSTGWIQTNISCTGSSGPAGFNYYPDIYPGTSISYYEHVYFDLFPGDNVVCTFTNATEPLGTLRIYKNIASGNAAGATFGYNISGTAATSTSIAYDSTPSRRVDVPLPPGTYNIKEILPVTPAGWGLTGVTCYPNNDVNVPLDVSGSPVGTPSIGAVNDITGVTIAPNEVTFCFFTNTYAGGGGGGGNLQIIKKTIGGDSTFNFSIPAYPGAPANIPVVTTGGNGSSALIPLAAGGSLISNIIEAPQSGWSQTGSVSCIDQGGTHIYDSIIDEGFTIYAGETTTCTFQNIKTGGGTGYLKIVKESYGANGTFNYTIFNNAATPGPTNETRSLTTAGFSLPNTPGTKEVTVAVPAGFQYDVIEGALPTGWSLTDAICVAQDGTSNPDDVVVAGETTTCTFKNTYTAPPTGGCGSATEGCLRLEKRTVGAGGTFTFASNAAFPTLTLDANASNLYNPVTEAPYPTGPITPSAYIDEIGLPPGFALTDAFCDTPYLETYNSGGDLIGVKNITIVAGGTTTCIFENTYTPLLSSAIFEIVKESYNDNGTFTYTISNDPSTPGPTNITRNVTTTGFDPGDPAIPATQTVTVTVPAGFAYDVLEGALPAGWRLDSAQCVGEDGSTNPDDVIPAGTTTTCTFVNTYGGGGASQGQLVIVKQTSGEDGVFSYEVSGPTPSADNISTVAGAGSTGGSPIDAGSYDIAETMPSGWEFGSVQCLLQDNVTQTGTVSGATISGVIVKSDETTTCEFFNSKTIFGDAAGGIKNNHGVPEQDIQERPTE